MKLWARQACLCAVVFWALLVPRCASGVTYHPAGSVASLTAAMTAANASVEDDVIDLGGFKYVLFATDNLTDGANGLPSVASAAVAGRLSIIDGTIERDSIGGTPSFRLLHVEADGYLALDHVTLLNGSLSGSGGAILNLGTLTVDHSTLANNFATSGGAVNTGAGASSTFSNSTFSANAATSGGAMLDEAGSTIDEIINCTFSGNAATTTGGAIMNLGLIAEFSSCTFAGNSAHTAGAIGNGSSGDIVNLVSTIMALNTAVTAADFQNVGFVVAESFNLVGDGSGSTMVDGVNNDQVGGTRSPLDPMLGPLADNGGPTQTLALLPGSPAIHHGANPDSLTFDQRGPGFVRSAGGKTDVGAYEVQPLTPTITTQASLPITVGGLISDQATVAGGSNPAGTLTFNAFTNGTCTGPAAFTSDPVTVAGNGNYSSGSFVTTAAGTYNFVVSYSGDANNSAVTTACLATNESVVVAMASPTIATQASSATVVGGTISDTATLAAGFSPTGTITFTAFANSSCSGGPAFTSAAVTVGGNGSYGSGNFTTSAAGTYNFIATYTGDSNNDGFTTTCLATNESVVVSPAGAALTTQASSSVVVGGTISDTATLAAGFNPAGTITFTAFASNTCSGPAAFTSAAISVAGNGPYGSGNFTTSVAGTYNFIAHYSGDGNNDAFTTGCLAANESVVAAKASPTLSGLASQPIGGGVTMTGTAMVAGGFAPTGPITYSLYGPDDATCSGAPVFTSTKSANGDGSYTSDSFTPSSGGTYRWVVSYGGDGNNNTAGPTACDDPAQAVSIAIATVPELDATGLAALVLLLAAAAFGLLWRQG